MKLATFEIPSAAGPLRRVGAAVDGRLIDLAAGYAAHLENTDSGCDAQRRARGFGRLWLEHEELANNATAAPPEERKRREKYQSSSGNSMIARTEITSLSRCKKIDNHGT